ncbi:MAG: AIR synthase family protein [bacterium]
MSDFLKVGKLPIAELQRLLQQYTSQDSSLIVGPRVGEDAAVVDNGDNYLVITADPITFATDRIGWYMVNVNANDIAVMGAEPKYFTATLLVPEGQTKVGNVEEIFADIRNACSELGVLWIGGHTEVTYNLDRMIGCGQMIGFVEKNKLVKTGGARVGDALILTKGVGIEGTAIIAREKEKELLPKLGMELIERAKNFIFQPGISVVVDSLIANCQGGVHSMHDPTEGGVATGIREMALASDVGAEICFESLPISPETKLLCGAFRIDPLGVISSGALLISCDPSRVAPIISALKEKGITARKIGRIVERNKGLKLIRGGIFEPLPEFEVDEITKIF